MHSLRLSLSLFFLLLCLAWGSVLTKDPYRIADEDGYFKREHSLFQPYQGMGMDVPFWEFGGATVITNQYVRLTPDRQSMRGALWNKTVPYTPRPFIKCKKSRCF